MSGNVSPYWLMGGAYWSCGSAACSVIVPAVDAVCAKCGVVRPDRRASRPAPEVTPEMGDLPYDAVSVNGRAMEWMVPLWNAVNARDWRTEGGRSQAHATGRMGDAVRIHRAVEVAMHLALECAALAVSRADAGGGEPSEDITDAAAEQVARIFCRYGDTGFEWDDPVGASYGNTEEGRAYILADAKRALRAARASRDGEAGS